MFDLTPYTRRIARLGCQCQTGHMQSSMSIYSCKTIIHNSQCSYLNSGLLVAPREYVLHGLILGMY
jgi:hypothetical protein